MSTKTNLAVLAAGAALVGALLVPIAPRTAAAQQAQVYPWCSTANSSTGSICAFTSFEQCRQSAKLCEQNPAYSGAPAYAAPYPGVYAAPAPGRRKRVRQ